MKLAVIIVNYRTSGLVIQCLESLLGQLVELNAGVVLVDNCSSDDSVETFKAWLAEHDANRIVRLIESDVNAGFSAGNNLGIDAVEAEYYLLLNSDTIVRRGAVGILMQTADDHPSAGIVGPRLEWPNGLPQESCFRYHSPVSEFIDAAKTGLITNALKRFNVPLPVSDKPMGPQWTSFACALIRRAVIADVGLMDDGYFMYFDDVDYCRRACKAGWNIWHNPQARVVHLRGGTSPVKKRMSERARLPRYFYASRARYFFVTYGWTGLTMANLLWWAGRAISKSREVFAGRDPSVPRRQWLDIWTNWLHPSARPIGSK